MTREAICLGIISSSTIPPRIRDRTEEQEGGSITCSKSRRCGSDRFGLSGTRRNPIGGRVTAGKDSKGSKRDKRKETHGRGGVTSGGLYYTPPPSSSSEERRKGMLASTAPPVENGRAACVTA